MASKTIERRPVVAIIGTCDTKLEALVCLRRYIEASKCTAMLIDISTSNTPLHSSLVDVSRADVLGAMDISLIRSSAAALAMMTTALTRTLASLHAKSSIAGVIGAGGSRNTSVCTTAFREALPIGFPKLMVSTMASGDVSHYVGETDITMMHSVVDVAGMNPILEAVLGNAASAIAGMASRAAIPGGDISSSKRPTVAITMFGVTTPCVQTATTLLEELGYEVVVFHATGAGGRAMERLIAEKRFVGVLDLTTTELADELVGGVLTAGPHRLEAASKAGIPQVVSLGALDMVNFGPRSSVPPMFRDRLLYEHNPAVTVMRTTKEECSRLGGILASKLSLGDVEKAKVVLPLRGLSLIDTIGGPFFDSETDMTLFDVVRREVRCEVIEVDSDINDPMFARAAVDALQGMLTWKRDA